MGTSSESSESKSSEVEYAADNNDVWVELKRGSEGVSLTVYEQTGDGDVEVVDETWWTWAEFTGIDTASLPISTSGTVALNAVPTQRLLTAQSVMDTIDSTGYRLANIEETSAGGLSGPTVDAELLDVLPREDAIGALEHELPSRADE